jgi:hypothetical protein
MEMPTHLEARRYLVGEFRRSTVGPGTADEELTDPPSRTYLCGFLSPTNSGVGEEQNEAFQEGDSDSSLEGIPSLINAMWPSAMGLTVHVKPGTESVRLTITLALYKPVLAADQGENAGPDKTGSSPKTTPVLGGLLAPPSPSPAAQPDAGEEGTPARGKTPAKREKVIWKRHPLSCTCQIPVSGPNTDELVPKPFADVEGPAAALKLDIRRHDHGAGAPKLLTLTLINCNEVPEGEWEEWERSTVFQPVLEVTAVDGGDPEIFVEAPAGAARRTDPDFLQHLLLYRHARDFATGHGCATAWVRTSDVHATATKIWTEFIPEVKVPELRYDLFDAEAGPEGARLRDAVAQSLPEQHRGDQPGAIFIMRHLGGGRDDAWVLSALEGLCRAYECWLDARRGEIDAAVAGIRDITLVTQVRTEVAEWNVNGLGREVLARMRAGIETLRTDPVAFRCFRLANQVMHEQLQMAIFQGDRRSGSSARKLEDTLPGWRPFQLAFLLMTVNSIASPDQKVEWRPAGQAGQQPTERELMDLIWFPTGGGKTEAYLGLTAFTLFHRRLRHPGNPDRGSGVGVVTRYTLRLLTTQQFERATRLICAAEELRTRGKDLRGEALNLGTKPFLIGLWIGGGSSPNYFGDIGTGDDPLEGAVTLLGRLQNGDELEFGADIRHVRVCPWCGTPIDLGNITVENAAGVRIRHSSEVIEGEPHHLIFRCQGTLPPPLKGTCPFSRKSGLPVQIVDEEIYAHPPSLLIGTVDKFARLTWSSATRPLFGRVNSGPALPPPDLIIQDELHLISGPLGTMVGIFESAIDVLARDERGRLPKVIGSTATIRRAAEQVWGLFRREVRQFPPPVLTAGETFFARVAADRPGRTYIGIMAPGVSGKSLFLRSCGALSQLASELPAAVCDPYWTLVCYFNSIRELAGANVLCQDDVPNYMRSFTQIRGQLGRREKMRSLDLPEELTSRRKAGDIPRVLQTLSETVSGGNALDLLLATNMISVGVDVDRLGVMLIQGQPKTTAEYIQASSRVGRKFPGLVVTLLNWTRSRDRSHYERFVPYHEAFYREVEATSVTPWSSPTRDRALSAVLITLLRHLEDSLVSTPAALGTLDVDLVSRLLRPVLDRVRDQDSREAAVTEEEVRIRLERWRNWAKQYGSKGRYGTGMRWDTGTDRFLRQPAAPRRERDGLEAVPNSMRTVEPETGFRLKLVKSVTRGPGSAAATPPPAPPEKAE